MNNTEETIQTYKKHHRLANYLSAAMLYLKDNFLLEEDRQLAAGSGGRSEEPQRVLVRRRRSRDRIGTGHGGDCARGREQTRRLSFGVSARRRAPPAR